MEPKLDPKKLEDELKQQTEVHCKINEVGEGCHLYRAGHRCTEELPS